jgi:hypothetical protein
MYKRAQCSTSLCDRTHYLCLAGVGVIFREMHSSSSLEQIDTGKVLDNEIMTYI